MWRGTHKVLVKLHAQVMIIHSRYEPSAIGESLTLFFSLLALERRRDFEEPEDVLEALRALRCSLRADSSRRSSLIAAVSRTWRAATLGDAMGDDSEKNSSSSSGKRSSSLR